MNKVRLVIGKFCTRLGARKQCYLTNLSKDTILCHICGREFWTKGETVVDGYKMSLTFHEKKKRKEK